MFEYMPIPLIAAWCIFTLFGFYQKLHIRDFKGESQVFLLLLNLSALGSMIFAVGFLVYYGVAVKWYLPLILLALGLAFKFTWFAIEAKLGARWIPLAFSLLGFVGWPACAIAMVLFLPSGT